LHGHRSTLVAIIGTVHDAREHLFDWFHIVKHLNEAVEEVRRSEMRRLSPKERVGFKRSRWLLLKNPWNLNPDQKERLPTSVRWNEPMVRAHIT